jgi:cobalamin synthase
MLEISTLISLVIYLIVIGLVFGLLWWLISYIGLPAPFAKVVQVILAVLSVLILIGVLLNFIGHPLIR